MCAAQLFKEMCLWPRIDGQRLQLDRMWQSPAVLSVIGKYRVLLCRLKQCWSGILLKTLQTYGKRNTWTASRYVCWTLGVCVCWGGGCSNFPILMNNAKGLSQSTSAWIAHPCSEEHRTVSNRPVPLSGNEATEASLNWFEFQTIYRATPNTHIRKWTSSCLAL